MFLRAFSSLASERDVDTKRMEKKKEKETLNIRLSGEGAGAAALPEKEPKRGESETHQLSAPLEAWQSPKKDKGEKWIELNVNSWVPGDLVIWEVLPFDLVIESFLQV